MSHAIHDSRYSWLRLTITLAIAMVANVGMWAVIVVMPAIETQFDAGRAEASLPYVLTMIGFALGNMWLGQLVDRLGVTKALIGAAVLSTVSYVLATLAPNMVMLSLAHLLVGLGTSIGFGPLIADISHWFMKRRGIAVALVASGNYLSGAIWPTLLSDILARDGWQQVYLTLALITPVIVIPLSLLLRRQVPAEAHQTAAVSASIKASSVGISPRALQYILGLAGIGCCVAMSMPQVHIVSYCVGLGYGPAVGAEMLSLMLLGGVVSRVISGMVADKLGGLMTLLIGSILQCISLFLFLPYDGMVSLYIISLMFGLAQGGIVPSYALVVREYMPPQEAGARVGFVMMMTIMGMALGGWMSGWIYDVTGNYQLAFINGILWNGLNIAILLMLLKRSRPRRQEVMA
ncbi:MULTISPECIES: MFS transporter [unclassified Ruegeria]|uniref:MFS transporter n=1 Tax=unclassified Ruegeria TaxID=2625375 RepID=UPI001ADAB2A6|nr:MULTISPECIES: MFS transporter [unclassified Ruegeria]MBO9412753.1 MFS transporter [Ruegeria sp. R8_1]MBO9416699.1 MFS transporter [Ruegeria sp. R8_2]